MGQSSPWNGLKKQHRSYSGKKKRHTQKAQILADLKRKRIVATAFDRGSVHDFALYKQSRLPLQSHTCCKADSGYQGVTKRHANSCTPKKRSKHCPLTDEQKAENRELARERMLTQGISSDGSSASAFWQNAIETDADDLLSDSI